VEPNEEFHLFLIFIDQFEFAVKELEFNKQVQIYNK